MTKPQRLSRSYLDCFSRMLKDVSAAPRVPANKELTAFWPMRGQRYNGSLMVIGRAVNGWRSKFTANRIADDQARSVVTEETRADSESPCPLKWVTERTKHYNPNTSAFWRTSRAVLLGIDAKAGAGPDGHWPSHLCWSNLMKVAPYEGGNPSTSLWTAQFKGAVELLQREIEEFSPDRILVLAGWSWFKWFVEDLGLRMTPTKGLVEGACSHQGRRWVLVQHPQGKDEGRLAREALEAFGAA